jgi:hypothetical protein
MSHAHNIRSLLRDNPHWGPQTLAENLGTTAHVVRVTASRENIRLMDRYEVEAYADDLAKRLEAARGKKV